MDRFPQPAPVIPGRTGQPIPDRLEDLCESLLCEPGFRHLLAHLHGSGPPAEPPDPAFARPDRAAFAVWILDLEQRFRYWNRAATRLYGWTAAEVVQRSYFDLFPAHEEPRTLEIFKSLMNRRRWHGTLTHQTRLGPSVQVESYWRLVRGWRGVADYLLVGTR